MDKVVVIPYSSGQVSNKDLEDYIERKLKSRNPLFIRASFEP